MLKYNENRPYIRVQKLLKIIKTVKQNTHINHCFQHSVLINLLMEVIVKVSERLAGVWPDIYIQNIGEMLAASCQEGSLY